MGQTPNHAFPYPELTDPADVPADVRALAEAVDAVIPVGPVIPPGEGTFVTVPILDVGLAGQNRAGRQLTATDFTQQGLAAPLGLWNLSSTSDASGFGRTLTNKGSVPFGVGINGQATTSAVFAGSVGQALYIDDTGVNDPLRIRTGSWGAWIRTAKRATAQASVTKYATSRAYYLGVGITSVVECIISSTGADATTVLGVSDVADDRWHLIVATFDATTLRLYVDGAREAVGYQAAPLFAGSAPLNIGGQAADAATAAGAPFYGRVDEAFVCGDVLSEDQVRALYCIRLAHLLGITPGAVRLNVTRKRKGPPLAPTDFTTQPLRLHNFTTGALTDQGSGNVTLTNNGAAVSVAAADGTPAGAFSFAGAQNLSATDAGLPAGTAARSCGCWFKHTTPNGTSQIMLAWASGGILFYVDSAGLLRADNGADSITGPYVRDGQWHQGILIEDNVAGDGVRRKLYLDGRLVGGSTVMGTLTLGGANSFRLGANSPGTLPFLGQLDGAFVCGYALTQDEVLRLYAKGSQALAPSPKDSGDHVEALQTTVILWTTDTLESQHTVDVGVVA